MNSVGQMNSNLAHLCTPIGADIRSGHRKMDGRTLALESSTEKFSQQNGQKPFESDDGQGP